MPAPVIKLSAYERCLNATNRDDDVPPQLVMELLKEYDRKRAALSESQAREARWRALVEWVAKAAEAKERGYQLHELSAAIDACRAAVKVAGAERVYIVAENINSHVIRLAMLHGCDEKGARDLIGYDVDSLTRDRHGSPSVWWSGQIKFDGCSDAHVGGDKDVATGTHRCLHLCGTDEIKLFAKGLLALHTVADLLLENGIMDCFEPVKEGFTAVEELSAKARGAR